MTFQRTISQQNNICRLVTSFTLAVVLIISIQLFVTYKSYNECTHTFTSNVIDSSSKSLSEPALDLVSKIKNSTIKNGQIKTSNGSIKHVSNVTRNKTLESTVKQSAVRIQFSRRGPYFVSESLFKYYSNYNMTRYEKWFIDAAMSGVGIGPETNPVYVKKYKFVQCLIPKNGIVYQKMVILKMLNPTEDSRWWILGDGIHFVSDISSNRLMLGNFNEEELDTIYNDESIKFFVFIRDPLQRALSGYLYFNWFIRAKSFDDLVPHLKRMMEENQVIDQHVRPQHLFCDLDHAINRFIQLSFNNRTHRKLFFDIVDPTGNLWDEVGSKGWHPALHETLNERYKRQGVNFFNYSMDTSKQSVVDFKPPTQHSMSTTSKLFKFFNMDNIADLILFYLRDYQLFQLSLPDFICNVIDLEKANLSTNAFQAKYDRLYNIVNDNFKPEQYPKLCFR